MPGNHSTCCGGLKFPDMPHLHAEDCPTRAADFKGPVLFRENPNERKQFDMGANLHGHPLTAVALSLDIWGRMSRGGSHAEQCFIMANECFKAKAALDEKIGPWLELAKMDDMHYKNGHQVLAKLADGTKLVVWWEDKIDYKQTCDTDTLKPGWVTGERHNVEVMSRAELITLGRPRTINRLVTYEPTHIMDIPE